MCRINFTLFFLSLQFGFIICAISLTSKICINSTLKNEDKVSCTQVYHNLSLYPSTRLRIAQIATPFLSVPPLDYGGTESVIYDLVEDLMSQGHDVTLFATGDSRTSGKLKYIYPLSLINANLPWTEIGKARKHLRWAFNEVIKENNGQNGRYRFKYDIVHFHLSSAADIIIFELASMSPIPIICTLHSNFPFDRREGRVGEEDRYYLRWSKTLPLVYLSETSKREAIKNATTNLRFVNMIPHGLAEDEFHDGQEVVRDALVWVGRMTPLKGTHLAVEAAVRANMTLILAGILHESEENIEYFNEKIKPLLDAYPNLIRFIGTVNRKQRSALLKRGLVFLNPILWEEPFGLVMIEAMAQGCPVISFKRGAAQRIIQPGINGDFADNLYEMVNKISVISETINRSKLIKWTRKHYSSKSMAVSYINAYNDVIQSFVSDKYVKVEL